MRDKIRKICAWIIYFTLLICSVLLALSKGQIAGYYIGFITYALITLILPCTKD